MSILKPWLGRIRRFHWLLQLLATLRAVRRLIANLVTPPELMAPLPAQAAALPDSASTLTATAAPPMKYKPMLSELRVRSADSTPSDTAARTNEDSKLLPEPTCERVAVPHSLSWDDYAGIVAQLQLPGSKVLDLTPADILRTDFFEALDDAWSASAETVPRLAIVMPFVRWAKLRSIALPRLQRMITSGIEITVLYQEQADDEGISRWLAGQPVPHRLPLVIGMLQLQSKRDSFLPLVIHALSSLVRDHAADTQAPALLIEVARLAQGDGDPRNAELAATLAREALGRLPNAHSVERYEARCILGDALIAMGNDEQGLAALDVAVEDAVALSNQLLAATALYQGALHRLDRNEVDEASGKLFRAAELLDSKEHPEELARVLHGIATVCLRKYNLSEAELHATAALELRCNPHTSEAEQDRRLLAAIRAKQRAPMLFVESRYDQTQFPRGPEQYRSVRIPVEIDGSGWLRMSGEVQYERLADRTIYPALVRMAPDAKVSELLGNGGILARCKRYNAALTNMRTLRDNFEAMVTTLGSLVELDADFANAHSELSSLEAQIDGRQKRSMGHRKVLLATLDAEIAYWEVRHRALSATAERIKQAQPRTN